MIVKDVIRTKEKLCNRCRRQYKLTTCAKSSSQHILVLSVSAPTTQNLDPNLVYFSFYRSSRSKGAPFGLRNKLAQQVRNSSEQHQQNPYVSEVIPQALQMTRVMRPRIDRIKVKGEDGYRNDEGEDVGESVDAETANLKVLQQNSEDGQKNVY